MKTFVSLMALVLLGLSLGFGTTNAQMVTNLYSFGNSPNDGSLPEAGLVQGSDGNFYGTTPNGGTSNNGTLFQISPSGTYTTLHSFVGYPTDGFYPVAGLVQGTDGDLYGTTEYGGTTNQGSVFRINPSGICTTLYSFVGPPGDGAGPVAGLVQGNDGNFYGTTARGGVNQLGTVFRISPSGVCATLYSFVGYPSDGSSPYDGLVRGSDGNFYGTTIAGGSGGSCLGGCGTVFRISSTGSETNIYSFHRPHDDGYQPIGLVQGSDGNFYGLTQFGGHGLGTVFRVSPNGNETNLHYFGDDPTDGRQPFDGLVQGSDGNFYGTTPLQGAYGGGTVFRISSSGAYTQLYSFVGNSTDGYHPVARVVQGSDGSFYGTTGGGGSTYNGTVFKLTVPINPAPYPINQITSIQLAGTNVVFTIPSIAYETYQLQFTTDPSSGIWSNVDGASVTNSIGAMLTLTNVGGALPPQGFYRFDITP